MDLVECVYYDSTDGTYKTDGVTTKSVSSTGVVTCGTTHMTDFMALLTPTSL